MPNSVVVAFTGGVTVESLGEGMARVSIDLSQGENGLVVDAGSGFRRWRRQGFRGVRLSPVV